LESIAGQTYLNIEHIIVNDGSIDNTQNIVEEFINTHQDKNIRLINIPNGGLANARNVGIKAATGEYMCNLDADDFLDSIILEKVAMSDIDFDICFWGYKDIDERNGKIINYYDKVFSFPSGIHIGYDIALLKLKKIIWVCQGNAVYRLEMIKSNNIWNIPGINQGEDAYFILRALIYAKNVFVIPVNAFNCLLRKDSMCHSSFNESHLEVLEVYKLLINDVSRYDFLDEKIRLELLLYIKRALSFERVNIAKRICKSYNIFQTNKAIYLMEKYDTDTGISYNSVVNVIGYMKRLEYLVYCHSKHLFFYLCKIYFLLKQ
jgi:glycosyltransferase involved in cell wall biosynthesis